MENLFNKLAGRIVLVTIFLTMFVPTSYVMIKAILLGLMLFSLAISSLSRSAVLNITTVMSIVILSTVGLFNSLHGAINSNPGTVPMLTVWVIWPLVYGLATLLLRNGRALYWLERVLLFSLIAVLAYTLIYLGVMSGILPRWIYFELDMGQDINSEFLEYRLYNITSLIFLIPFVATNYYLRAIGGERFGIFAFVFIFICTVVVILSGRRALQVNFLLLPLYVFASLKILSSSIKMKDFIKILIFCESKILGVLVLMVVIGIYRYDNFLYSIMSNFEVAYDIVGSDKESERADQFYVLVEGWLASPLHFLFGYGNGSTAEIIRSREMPWAYELTYIYLLFSTGFIGALFYFGWFVLGLMRLRHAVLARPDLLLYVAPLLSGVFGLTIAAITNPYFAKFDYLWIVLLPHLLSGGIKYQTKVFQG